MVNEPQEHVLAAPVTLRDYQELRERVSRLETQREADLRMHASDMENLREKLADAHMKMMVSMILGGSGFMGGVVGGALGVAG